MKILYTTIKHLSGLGMIFFTVTLIIVVTDLENIPNVPVETWFIKIGLIASCFIINKLAIKKLASDEQVIDK